MTDPPKIATWIHGRGKVSWWLKGEYTSAPADLTPQQLLALAVLEGDTEAALALADEVHLQHRQGEDYLSRKDIIEAIRPFASACWEHELYGSGQHMQFYTQIQDRTVTMAQVQELRRIVNHEDINT